MNPLERIKQFKPGDWYPENTPSRPLMVSGIARGFTTNILKNYKLVLCYFSQGKVSWITLIKDQQEIGELIWQKQMQDNKYWLNQFATYEQIRNNLAQNFDLLKNKYLRELSDNQLVEDINNYVTQQWATRKYDSLVDPYLFYAENKLPELLRQFVRAKAEIALKPQEAMEIITKPEVPFFLNKYFLDLIDIARSIKSDHELAAKILAEEIKEADLPQGLIERIKKHADKYCWIKVESFYGANEYTFNHIINELQKLLAADLEAEENQHKAWQHNKKIRQEFLIKHNFSDEIRAFADLAPVFAKWQDLRKINSVMTTYLHAKYLQELSRRLGLTEDELAYHDFQELTQILQGKIGQAELQKRKEGCLFVFQNDGFEMFYKEDVQDLINDIVNPDLKGITEFSGMVASTGQTQGTVKIVITVEDMQKMNKGDILVSTMTRPEHLPAMKKASAIITDEGGITCHAAIISRELNIPCVIGTKIATHVLKDGDQVEVDANQGIVKIIK